MQTKIGTTEYSKVHNEIRKRAAEKRNERKRALALQVSLPFEPILSLSFSDGSMRELTPCGFFFPQAINDPEEDAKRKSRRAEQKKNQKKRKVAAFADKKERFGDGSKRRRGGE